MKKVTSVDGIKDPYTKRILTNILGLDPMEVLRSSPKKLKAAVRGLKEEDLRRPPAKGTWSIAQIRVHMSDSELVASYSYRKMLSESGTDIQAYDENAWAKKMRYDKANTLEKLKFYEALRNDNVAFLESLSAAELECYGMHAERGKETIERLAQMVAGHDINHVRRVVDIGAMFSDGRNPNKRRRR